jgi:hypothetical protein
MEGDEQRLDTLGVLYFVLAGLFAVIGCVPIVHAILGLRLLWDPGFAPGASAGPFNPGWLFLGVSLVLMLSIWTLAVLLGLTGRCLRERRARTFCFVMAVIVCSNFPLGTLLGVFTIVTLTRPSVKLAFQRNTA